MLLSLLLLVMLVLGTSFHYSTRTLKPVSISAAPATTLSGVFSPLPPTSSPPTFSHPTSSTSPSSPKTSTATTNQPSTCTSLMIFVTPEKFTQPTEVIETNSTPTSSPYTCRSSCSYFIFPPPNHRRPTRKEIRRGLRKGEPAKNRQMIKQQKVDQQGLQHRCNQGFACLVCVMGLCIAGEFFGERARGIEPQYSNPNLQDFFFPVQLIVCVLITASLLVHSTHRGD